jgi:integrase
LRSSELRGLRRQDIDFAAKDLHVRQRADRYYTIGRAKSEAGERTVPIPAPVLNALREWKLKTPKSKLDLAFCYLKGNIESRGNIIIED